MSKQVLSIEQMQRLQELGVDTSNASMCRVVDGQGITGDFLCIRGEESFYFDEYSRSIPAFTLQDIMDLLPRAIDMVGCFCAASLYMDFANERIVYGNTDRDGFEIYHEEVVSRELIDAAYNMLVWVIENGYIKMEETK